MAQKIKVEVNVETKDAQKDVKDLDKDFVNLGDSAKDAGEKTEDAGNKIKGAGSGAEKSGKDAKEGAKGWNIFGKALRMTGIGALVGVLFKFSEVLMGNQRVMDSVNAVANTMSIIFSDLVNLVIDTANRFIDFTAELGSVEENFNKVKQSVIDFGGAIKTYIFDKVKEVVEGVGLLGKAISKLFKGEFKEAGELAKEGAKTLWNANPVVDLTNKTVEYGKELGEKIVEGTKKAIEKGKEYIKTTYEQGKAIVQTRNEITQLIGTLEQERVAIQKNIDEKTRQRDNENLTFEERKEAAQELLKLEEDLLAKEIELAEARVENAQAELRVNQDNLQMQQDLAIAQANLTELKNKDVEQITTQTQAIHDLTVLQTDSINELHALTLQGFDSEMFELKKFYKEKLEQARKAGIDEEKIKKEFNKRKEEIENKYIRKSINASANFIGALANTQEKGSAKWKAMAKAQALINTYLGVTAALKDPEMPFVARILNAGTQLLMGMNNVRAISQTQIEGGDSGDSNTETDTIAGAGAGGGAPEQIATLVPEQLVENLAGSETPPVQAFVIENDISNAQALQEELEIQSTL
jgi:hypothetical protein